jgi:membrane-associated phospholipid phosphatase
MNQLRKQASLTALLIATCQLTPAAVHAETTAPRDQPTKPLWRDSWPELSWLEGLTTVAAGAGTLVLALQPPTQDARWQGGILFDGSVRDAVRLESAKSRQRARYIGDLTYRTAPVLPLLVDPLLVAWFIHRDSRAALNMAGFGIEAFSYAGLLSFISTRISARERPDSVECRSRHPDGTGCGGVDTESFWSGHASIAATSAGLTCANHRYLPLWGHPAADAIACALASSAAVTTGMSRLAADRHYASDVLLGMGLGFGIGYAVPVLLHYSRKKTRVTVSVTACTGRCLGLRGSF